MKKNISIYYKLAIAIILVNIIFLTTLGYFLTTININTLHRLVKEYYLSITDNISGQIQNKIGHVVQNLNEFSSILVNKKISGNEKLNLIALKILHSPQINYVLIYDEKGNFVDMLKPKSFSFPFDINKYLKKNTRDYLSKNDKYISQVIYPGTNSYPYIKIIVKWQDKNTLYGYLVTYYNLKPLSDTVAHISKRRFNQKNSIFLVDNNGDIIAHHQTNYVLSRYNLIGKEIFQNIKTVASLKKIFLKDLGFSSEYNSKGKQIIGNFSTIPQLNFGVIVQEKKEVAFASVKKMISKILLWLVIAIVFSMLIAFLLSKIFTGPIYKLVNVIKTITDKKQLGLQVEIKNNDEIGILASSFNKMSSELLHYSKQLQESTEIQTNLSRYFSPAIVAQITKSKDMLTLGGMKKKVAILFVDIHDFTTISENSDPQNISMLLNKFFSKAVDIIFKWDGTIDKFIGDAVMAIFNAPYDVDDYLYKSIMAGKEIIDFVKKESYKFKEEFGYNISIGIGINEGEAVVGNLGSADIMEYTAIGDVVNTAARLEAVSGINQLLITENCYNQIKDRIHCKFLDKFLFKGKQKETNVYLVD